MAKAERYDAFMELFAQGKKSLDGRLSELSYQPKRRDEPEFPMDVDQQIRYLGGRPPSDTGNILYKLIRFFRRRNC